jgi:hypothetical protein
MTDAEEIMIQTVPAYVWHKLDNNQYVLLFTKNDVTIQIFGSITCDEILKIAENISF